MQTQLDLFNPPGDSNELSPVSTGDAKDDLIYYINTCGLIAFKDYYMGIKMLRINHIPDGYTRDQFLMLCKEVYQSQAQRVERTKIKRR